MLSCRRTDAYLAALEVAAPSLIRGKAVLDVGCGSGVLSLACARLGARVVYAVEASSMAVMAERIVSDNGMAGIVKVIRGSMEEVWRTAAPRDIVPVIVPVLVLVPVPMPFLVPLRAWPVFLPSPPFTVGVVCGGRACRPLGTVGKGLRAVWGL
jgi:2-polyprenyl-3-methyl-5-hydroxy-6-metoxy-1,4-benzoquinol methylase